jgi:hypothetical protein
MMFNCLEPRSLCHGLELRRRQDRVTTSLPAAPFWTTVYLVRRDISDGRPYRDKYLSDAEREVG